MPVLELLRGDGRRLLSESLGDLLIDVGSLASGPNATAIAQEAFVWASDKHVVGAEAFIHTGGGLGQARDILSFTPFSAASATTSRIGVLGVLQEWNPVPSTNSQVEIHRMFTVSQYNNALDRAIRRAALVLRVPRNDFSLILNSPLENGTFQHWTNGVALAPDGWTLGGSGTPAVARVTDFHLSSPFGAQVTRSGENTAFLSQSVPNYLYYTGGTVTLRAKGWSSGTGINLELTDGLTTPLSRTNGAGIFDLSVELTVAAAATELTATITKTSVAGGVMVLGKVWLEPHQSIYRYDIPTGPQRVTEIYIEDTVDGRFDAMIPPRWWYIDREQRQLVFIEDYMAMETGRALRMVCQGTPQIPGADTDNLPVDSEYLIMQARQYLLESLPWDEEDTRQYRSRYDRDGATLRRMEEAWGSRMRDEPGSIAIGVM